MLNVIKAIKDWIRLTKTKRGMYVESILLALKCSSIQKKILKLIVQGYIIPVKKLSGSPHYFHVYPIFAQKQIGFIN